MGFERQPVVDVVAVGLVGGILGGVAFALSLVTVDMLPTIAGLLGSSSPLLGFMVHLLIAGLLGSVFGLLTRDTSYAAGSIVLWGVMYGMVWWLLGTLTLLPLLSGAEVNWQLATAQRELPALLGHLLFGAVVGLFQQLMFGWDLPTRVGTPRRERLVSVAEGIAAGLSVAGFILLAFDGLDLMTQWPAFAQAGTAGTSNIILLTGVLVGLIHGASFSTQSGGLAQAIVRGLANGLVLWLILGITVFPAALAPGLVWQLENLSERTASFPAFVLLFGVLLAVLHHSFGSIRTFLFSQDVRGRHGEGVGFRGVRAALRGSLAGSVGGFVFAGVMAQQGFFPGVAGLVGSTSVVVGIVLHLLIAIVIGMSYALLFREQSFDAVSGMGWGVSFGVLWWFLGPLTLLPLLTEGSVTWDNTLLAAAFPALIAHIAYGAFVGLIVHVFEGRYNPWWVTRTEVEERRVGRVAAQLNDSAPALWSLILVLALVVPLILT